MYIWYLLHTVNNMYSNMYTVITKKNYNLNHKILIPSFEATTHR